MHFETAEKAPSASAPMHAIVVSWARQRAELAKQSDMLVYNSSMSSVVEYLC